MTFILQKVEPTIVTVQGQDVPLFFSLRAAAMIETELKRPYREVISKILLSDGEGEETPLTTQEAATVVHCLAKAAGYDLPVETILDMHTNEAAALVQGAVCEIIYKTPMAKKNETPK